VTETVTIDGEEYKVTPELTQMCASELVDFDNSVEQIRIEGPTELTLIMDGDEHTFETADFLQRASDKGYTEKVKTIIEKCGLFPIQSEETSS
jgi:hypothetical protein